MNFQFTSSEAALTKTVATGGFGLSTTDLTGATWQGSDDYQFNLHSGYHAGEGNHYIYVFSGRTPPRSNASRLFVDGKRAGEYVAGSNPLSSRGLRDAVNVITRNKSVFVKLIKAFYDIKS